MTPTTHFFSVVVRACVFVRFVFGLLNYLLLFLCVGVILEWGSSRGRSGKACIKHHSTDVFRFRDCVCVLILDCVLFVFIIIVGVILGVRVFPSLKPRWPGRENEVTMAHRIFPGPCCHVFRSPTNQSLHSIDG